MAASESDFTTLVPSGSGVFPADQHPKMARAIQALTAYFNAKVSVGSEPDDNLQYVEFGDAGQHNHIRVGYNGLSFVVDDNTGTEGSPVWTTRFSIIAASGNSVFTNSVTIPGALLGITGLSLASGNIDVGGGNVTNAADLSSVTGTFSGAVNGFTIGAPSGAPPDVAAAGAVGTATRFSREDHTHKGVASLDTNASGTPLSGALNLVDGTGISISKAGSDITIDASAAVPTYGDGVQIVGSTVSVDLLSGGYLSIETTQLRYDPPDRQYITLTGADKTAVTAEIVVQNAAATLCQVQLANADGAKKYRVSYSVSFGRTGSTPFVTARVRMGALGTTSDAIQHAAYSTHDGNTDNGTISIPCLEITPAANDWVSLTIEAVGGTVTQFVASGYQPILEVVEIQE